MFQPSSGSICLEWFLPILSFHPVSFCFILHSATSLRERTPVFTKRCPTSSLSYSYFGVSPPSRLCSNLSSRPTNPLPPSPRRAPRRKVWAPLLAVAPWPLLPQPPPKCLLRTNLSRPLPSARRTGKTHVRRIWPVLPQKISSKKVRCLSTTYFFDNMTLFLNY